MRSQAESQRDGVLYVSYDGMCDHIAESQVLPYVLGLARRGWRMSLVSHEKSDVPEDRRKRVARQLAEAGVTWLPQRYLRGHPMAALGLHLGMEALAGLGAARQKRIGIVHARSYIPAGTAALLRSILGARMLFDMRGFWLDEKIDAGAWQKGRAYWTGKRVERALFSRADAVVSLTHAAARELESWRALADRGLTVDVIPTCLDLAPHAIARHRAHRTSGPTLAYLGSFGPRYLSDEMIDLFARVHRRSPGARLLVLAHHAADAVAAACAKYGVPTSAVEVTSVPHDQVPARLATVDATLCLIKPGFAVKASCPTKFGESLAAGAPVVVNTGVGDCDVIARDQRVGVVTGLDRADFDRVATEVLALLDEGEPMRERCRAVARSTFDLDLAVDHYDAIYQRLTGAGPAGGDSPRARV